MKGNVKIKEIIYCSVSPKMVEVLNIIYKFKSLPFLNILSHQVQNLNFNKLIEDLNLFALKFVY